MNRRKFLVKGIAGAGIIAVGGGYWWLNSGKGVENVSINGITKYLNQLDLTKLSSSGSWSVNKIFSHLAQSIEYSMSGYPEQKSDVFKNSIGSLAFKVFSQRGEMTHGLDEKILGAPVIKEVTNEEAFERLIQSLRYFEGFHGQLKPHFAYGDLTKEEYTLAHIMHIENHLIEISQS